MRFFLFILFAARLGAATYYVSAAGNDSNAGTSSGSPWLTIGKVNTVGVAASDTVNFRGGDTFSGNLLVNPGTPPSGEGQRITVTSYGTGKATISCADSYGVKILNCGYVTVSNLIITGSGVVVTGSYPNKTGTTTNTTGAVLITTTTDSTWYSSVFVDNVEASGTLMGAYFLSVSTTATVAHENWRITNCYFHNIGVCGIFSRGTTTIPGSIHNYVGILYRNGYIYNTRCEFIPGITSYDFDNGSPTWTGFGIFLINCQDTLVELCKSKECGDAAFSGGPGGPVGLIFVECRSSTFRSCEASKEYATGGFDGNGIDLDGGCQDCIIEKCYVHDCEGPGTLVFQFNGSSSHFGSILRYNLVTSCSTVSGIGCYREVNTQSHPKIYNNTFIHPKSGGSAEMIYSEGGLFYNNIFVISAGANFGQFYTGTVLQGNTYRVGSGSTFSVFVQGNTYTSLAGMQTDGFEKFSGGNVGASGDPMFTDVTFHAEVTPAAALTSISAFDLGAGSVAHNAGVSQATLGIPVVTLDWHGNNANAGVDSGAVRFGSVFTSSPGSPNLSFRRF